MSKLLFTILTVAKHPCGTESTNTYQITAVDHYDAVSQAIDSIHSYGLSVVSWDILDTKDTTKGKP
jgi:hypothetical protein